MLPKTPPQPHPLLLVNAVIGVNANCCEYLATKFGLDVAAIQTNDRPTPSQKTSLTGIQRHVTIGEVTVNNIQKKCAAWITPP